MCCLSPPSIRYYEVKNRASAMLARQRRTLESCAAGLAIPRQLTRDPVLRTVLPQQKPRPRCQLKFYRF